MVMSQGAAPNKRRKAAHSTRAKRSDTGSAFARCEACGRYISVALLGTSFHQCGPPPAVQGSDAVPSSRSHFPPSASVAQSPPTQSDARAVIAPQENHRRACCECSEQAESAKRRVCELELELTQLQRRLAASQAGEC
jgi:hypothetical protein